MQLKDYKQGDQVEGLQVLLEKAAGLKTKNGRDFFKFTARDGTGSIEGVFWNYMPDLHQAFKEGTVVEVTGRMDAYNGAPQLVADDLELRPDVKPDSFARWTKFDVATLWGSIVEKVHSFKEPLTKYVAEELLLHQAAVVEALKRAPAAKSVHNNWYGGLLEHVWSLCEIAEPIIAHYQKHYWSRLSRDKVLFGLMLHDAGKIIEYDYKNPAFTFTAVGTFTPHMVIGPAWVYEQANKWHALVGKEAAAAGGMTTEQFKLERAHLMHVLAAHHGQIEWGSPVKPSSMEAILVHHLDNLDAKMLHAWDYAAHKPGPIPGFSQPSHIERVSYFHGVQD